MLDLPYAARRCFHFLSVLCLVFAVAGCDRRSAPPSPPNEAHAAAAPAPPTSPPASVNASSAANPAAPAAGRRVIRTAEIWLETDDPQGAVGKVSALADTNGGFVLGSDLSRSRQDDGEEVTAVTVVVRVPATAFDSTLETLRGLGKRVSNEKVAGQDVTEEYVDLEARIKAQRAIEDQYLTILKEAKAIHEILEVEQKLGEVRTEIERAEGRRRFLEDQTTLSTLSVHLARHIEALEAAGPGFGASVKKAAHDAVDVAVAIVNGAIRAFGVLAPLAALVGAPAWLLAWIVVRRKRARTAVA